MFDIGWTELMVIACVAIIVVGPKDLPRMLRTLGQTIGKMRRMSREFQSTFNDALREAEKQADIADMKKQVEDAANFNPLGDLKKSIEADATAKKPPEKDAGSKESASKSTDADVAASSPEPDVGGETPVAIEDPAAPSTAASKPADNPVTEDVKA